MFAYIRFLREEKEKEAIIKALNRKVKTGELAKVSKGRYYKPEKTAFGVLQPAQEEVVKDLLKKGRKEVGYLTGLSIYNSLGLTTQIGNTIQIGKNDVRPAFQRGKYKISFIRQKNPITRTNIPLLQILDAIRYIKRIPDTTVPDAIERLKFVLKKRENEELQKMVFLAVKYPPSTRALLGAMLQATKAPSDMLESLKASLNPITTYRLEGVQKVLDTAQNWNLK